MKKLTIKDLLPTGDDLFNAAYSSTSGDATAEPYGVHQGRDPHRRDTMGISKTMIHDRALAGDYSWFEALAQGLHAQPFRLPPSLRTDVPKDETNPSKGTRPIDDPAELKRLITLHVRRRLGRNAERLMTPGQYGGRPAWSIQPTCLRPGSTTQDHLATAIHQAIWQGFPVCLSIDLKDAFGLVPRRAALKEFSRLNLDDEAAKWLWRLVRIDAVEARNRKRHYRRVGRGIEQGNPLSSMTMNLVLAPIFTTVESTLNVRCFSYLDDIYICCPTAELAQEAFRLFKQSARGRGFTNVRRLWQQGDPTDSKLSRVIDTRFEVVPVLKTYLIDALGISLDPKKVEELRKDGKLNRKLYINELRQVSRCQALTKGATRARTPGIIRGAQKNVSEGSSYRSSAAGDVGDRNPKGHLPVPIYKDRQRGRGVQETLGSSLSTQGLPQKGKAEGDRNPIPNGLAGRMSGDDELPYPCHRRTDDGLDGCDGLYRQVGGHSHDRPNQGNQAGDIPPVEDSPATEGRNSRDRREADAAGRPPCLSILSEEGQRLLTSGNREPVGTTYKGRKLDLLGLSNLEVVKNIGVLPVVNQLLKLVRVQRRATVVIDPAEEWTANSDLLGNLCDPVYERERYELQPDGSARLALFHRRQPKPKPKRMPTSAPPQADLIVYRIRCVNYALWLYEVQFSHQGQRHRLLVPVGTPNSAAGALRALGTVIQQRPAASVAVRRQGLTSVAVLLADEDGSPAHVALSDAAMALRRWSWRRDGSWMLGTMAAVSPCSRC